MSDELRWGIIGCGTISHDFARSLKNCKHKNKIVAAAASSQDKSEEFIREFGLDAKAYDDYAKLLQDERVEVVYIGLLNFSHLEWILKSLDAGKHVLCEKPMVINSDQIKQVMDKAREKKRFVMEAFWSRFFPIWRKIRETIESKELGELKVVGLNFGEHLMENRFHLHKDESPLIDIGYYVVGLAMYSFDDEKPEKAEIACEKDSNGVDLWGNITLKFKNGRHALLYYNGTMRASTAGYFAFEKGLIEIPYFFWCPQEMVKTKGMVPDAKQEKIEFPLNDYDGYELNNCAGLHYEADHVYERIKEGQTESPVMPLKNTQQIVEVLDGLRQQIGVQYKND